jgi:hypothetical protein
MVTLAPGGATIHYFGIETVTLTCDTCAAPAVPAVAQAALARTPRAERLDGRLARRVSEQVARRLKALDVDAHDFTREDVGAFSTTQGLRIGFGELFRRHDATRRRVIRGRQLSAVDNAFADQQNLHEYVAPQAQAEWVSVDRPLDDRPTAGGHDALFADGEWDL